jgi:hypothetical protein
MTQPSEPQTDPIEELIDFLTPAAVGILRRLDADEFTTIDFIEVLKTIRRRMPPMKKRSGAGVRASGMPDGGPRSGDPAHPASFGPGRLGGVRAR